MTITLQEVCNTSIVSAALDKGGGIYPLLIQPSLSSGTGLMNPSILKDGKRA